jgi:hypothetical protein
MTTHEPEMLLRQALLSATDSIEPRPGALDKIQRKLRQPYFLPIAWADAIRLRVALWLPEGTYTAGREVAGKLRTAARWFFPKPVSADSKPSPWSLLRPLTAFALTVFLVAFGAYVAINPSALSNSAGQHGHSHNGGPGLRGGGSGLTHGANTHVPSSGTGNSPTPSTSGTSCPPSLNQLGPSGGHPSSSSSNSPSPTVSPTPTNSGSPSPTGSPTPTPSGSVSSAPTSGASAAAGAVQPAVIRATTDALILPATVASPCSTPTPHRTKPPAKRLPTHAGHRGTA